MVPPDEEPRAALQREILEETGFQAKKLEPIYTFYVSPGGTSERIFLFYAEIDLGHRLSPGGGVSSEQEDIEVLELPLDSVWEMLDRGKIQDAKTIIGLLWLRRRLESKE